MRANTKTLASLALLLACAAGAVIWGTASWKHSQVFISTDNAYVKGHVVAVAAKVPGTLLTLQVQDNQPVKAGQIIATLDPRDFDAALARARASISEARNGVGFSETQIAQAEAQLQAAESQLELATTEKARYAALYDRHSLPKQKLDYAVSAEKVATAQVAAAKKQIAGARSGLGVSQSKLSAAQAATEQAELFRSYCTILAPTDGYVSRKMAEAGMVVAPGQPLLCVVPLGEDETWVEANFKETELRNVRPGQPVTLKVDLDDRRTCKGTVESLSAGTGAAFSLLPAENATGNWVKVVQRVPVRIKLNPASDPDKTFRIGLTVSVEIDTRGTGQAH